MKKKIVLFGFGQVEYDDRATLRITSSGFEYFSDFVSFYDEIVAFIPLVQDRMGFTKEGSHPRVLFRSYRPTKFGFIRAAVILISESRDADVLVFIPASSRLTPIIKLIKRRARSFNLCVEDDPYAFVGRLSLSFLPGYDAYYRRGLDAFFSASDVIFTAGKYLRRLLAKDNKCVLESLPIGQSLPSDVRVVTSDVVKVKKQKTVLFLNRIVRNKGVFELFQAFELLYERMEGGVELIFAGDGDALEDLKQHVSSSDLTHSIRFTGWVDRQQELEELWDIADVYVLPSTETEGRPRGIEEAIARRVPVIASAVGGIPLEFENGEIRLVPPRDIEVLATEIELLLLDSEARAEQLECAESRRNWLYQYPSAAAQHANAMQGSGL